MAKWKKVIVRSSPVSDRYWKEGDTGIIENNQIRASGCWFDFDDRWVVEELPKPKKQI